MTDKVIQFPKHKVVRDLPGEVLEERQKRADQKMADSIVSDLTAILVTELDNYYVSVEDESFTKDLVLVVDALRAAVYRQFGFEHHLHPFIEKNITIISKKDAKEMEDMSQEQLQKLIENLLEAKEHLDDEDEE
jgi:predicted AlkP superfamily pyrophosphatase or phosphodiesterase